MPKARQPLDPVVWEVLELAVVDHDFLSRFLTDIDEALNSRQIVLTNAQRAQLDSILKNPVPVKSVRQLLEVLERIFRHYDTTQVLKATPPPPPTW